MTSNPFFDFKRLGYVNLLPIVPPDAKISPKSQLHKRVGTSQDGRGKTPGVKTQDGDWTSLRTWQDHKADDLDLQRWFKMGAGVGLRTGDGLIAIDADTLDKDAAKKIYEALAELVGEVPVRIGQSPKALYPLRVTDPVQYQRVEFGPPREGNKAGRQWRVEVLSTGRQFVAHGIHPKTGKPYAWPVPLVAFDKLPLLRPEQVSVFLEKLRTILPDCGELVKEGGGADDVNQVALRGDPAMVRRAVEAIPNTSEHFGSRESYVSMGYAIKAAVEDEQIAFDIFREWAERWDDKAGNAPEVVEADWSRMKGPYKRGANWLYETAEELGDFSVGEVWLTDLTADVNPFDVVAEREEKAERENRTDTFPLVSVADLRARPPAEWLIARHVPRQSVGFLYSRPGAGKTFVALDAALHIAAGAEHWHGDALQMPENAVVLYLASEGSYGFRNRIEAWLNKNGDKPGVLDRFKIIEVSINFMSADDINKLLRTVRSIGLPVALTVVDTVSRALPGADENLQKDMTLFVKACDAVKAYTGGAVLGVHHAGKSGDMRGSTVLLGAGDFVFRLDRKEGASAGNLHCEKMKDGPDGWDDAYRFDVVKVGEKETSITVERLNTPIVKGQKLTPALTHEVLDAMRKAWDAGEPWARHAQTGERCATRRMAADFGFDAVKASEAIDLWEATGMIAVELRDKKTKRSGYRVLLMPEQGADIDLFN